MNIFDIVEMIIIFIIVFFVVIMSIAFVENVFYK